MHKYALEFKSEMGMDMQYIGSEESIPEALGKSIIHVDDFFMAINIFCLDV